MIKNIRFICLLVGALSITAQAEFTRLSIQDSKKILEKAVYANKKETIMITVLDEYFYINFKLNSTCYLGIQALQPSPSEKFMLSMDADHRSFFDTAFELWAEKDQVELRFKQDEMELSTTVRLYPLDKIDSSLTDDKYYTDGFSDFVTFIAGESSTYKGIKFADLLAQKNNYAFLEKSHDYIQHLFPTMVEGRALAPLLNDDIIGRFMARPELQGELLKAFDMMLNFYGLERTLDQQNNCIIVKNNNFKERTDNWISPSNHNYLRITRILTSLKLLGLKNEAHAFLSALNDFDQSLKNCIGKKTYAFWFEALELVPDGDNENAEGENYNRKNQVAEMSYGYDDFTKPESWEEDYQSYAMEIPY